MVTVVECFGSFRAVPANESSGLVVLFLVFTTNRGGYWLFTRKLGNRPRLRDAVTRWCLARRYPTSVFQ